MPIALGITSRPTYDAAEPLLRNKQIEYQRELELKRLAQQAKLARQQAMMQGLGMLNQNLQQQASQANQRAMQQEAIQARMQEQQAALEAQGRSLLERQFNQMEANWREGVAKAEANNMGFDPQHQPRMAQIKESMLKIDQAMAAGDIDPANGFRQKMALLQQLATFKPDTRIKTLQEQMQERMIRVGPNGQILGPNDPPMQGERLGTVNEKGVFDPFTPLPAPKPDPAVVAQQKMLEATKKEERRLTEKFITETESRLKEKNDLSGAPRYDRKGAEAAARQSLAPSAEQFEREFGVPHPALKQPPPQPRPAPSAADVSGAQSFLQQNPGPFYDAPDIARRANEARAIIGRSQETGALPQQGSAPAGPPPQAEMPATNLNGQPLNDFARYALDDNLGRQLNEQTFQQSPLAGRMSYEEFDAVRSQLESQVPILKNASEAGSLPPGAMFKFSDRGPLLSNIPNQQPKPPVQRPRAPGGAGGGGGQPKGPGQGGQKQQMPPPGRPQQPQQPQKRGMPLDRILGSGDGKDRRGNTPPRTQLILKKGDPANQKLFDEVISKLTPEQAKQLFVAEVDPSQPAGPDNRMDLVTQHDIRAFPTLIREEWDGKKYVKADVMISPRTSDALSAFMKNGKNPPPPEGNMAHTYVFLDRADKSGAAQQWAKIASQMTPAERANVTVFQVDSSQPDSPTNDMLQAANLNIKSFPAVVRGEWNGQKYALKAEAQGPKALEPLKDIKTYRDFARPDRDRHAEGVAKVAAEDAKAFEDAKAQQVVRDTEARGRLSSQFDKNVRNSGNPLGSMKIPAAGESGYENFKRAFDEWVASGGKSDGLSLDQHIQQREASAVNTPEKAKAVLRAYNDPKNPLGAANVAEARRVVDRLESRTKPATPAERQAAVAGQKVLDIRDAQNTVAKENPKFPIPRGQDKRLDAAKDLLREAGNPPKVTPAETLAAHNAVEVLKDRDRELNAVETSALDGAKELLRKAESPKNPTNPERVKEAQAVIEKATAEGQQPAAAQQPAQRGNIPAALPRGATVAPPAASASGGFFEGISQAAEKIGQAVFGLESGNDASPAYNGEAALRDIQEIQRLHRSGSRNTDIEGRVQRWADNTLNKGNTKIGGYDLIGEPKASPDDAAIAKDIKQAAGFPKGTGVLQGLKQIAEGKANPVSVDAARQRLDQRIQKMLEQNAQPLKQQQKSQQSQQQDRDRLEQQRLRTAPTIQPSRSGQSLSPIKPQAPVMRPVSQLPPLQPSRTAQLKQGLATSVMRPGQLNIDEINAGLSAMTGPRPQPYTGGILGGMQKPPTEPSNQLGMGINPMAIFGPGGSVGPGGGVGNFITQPGYTGLPGNFYDGFSQAPQYNYGYNTAYPDFGGGYVNPMIDIPFSNYGMSDQYGGIAYAPDYGGYDYGNNYSMEDISSFGPPGAFSPGPEIIAGGDY